MTETDFNKALLALMPGAKFSHNNVPDDASDTVQVGPFAVQWVREQAACPSWADVQAKWDAIKDAEGAKAVIAALEDEQLRRLTPRGDREFRMALFVSAGLTSHPAFVALKAIDDAIKVERAKL